MRDLDAETTHRLCYRADEAISVSRELISVSRELMARAKANLERASDFARAATYYDGSPRVRHDSE